MIHLYGYENVLIQGTVLTIKLGLASLVLGLTFGLIGAAMKLSRFFILKKLADIYTTVVRGIPELLFVMFVYFGGTILLNAILKSIGYTRGIDINPFWAGVTALSVMFGAYATEVFRMAFQEIPKGQWEAAQTVGLKPSQTFFRIILPQVWAVALPGLGNLFLVLLKDTALISVVGLQDLMFFASRAAQTTSYQFTFYMAAAFIYLGLTTVVMGVISYAEYLSNPSARYAKRLAKVAKPTLNQTQGGML